MNRDTVNWRGYWVAAPTPFTRSGDLDERAFRGSLRLYEEQRVHGVLVNGTTGEWFSQNDAERRRVAEIAVEELKGIIPVVVGCTTFTPSSTIELAKHAAEIGADGVMSTPPPYVAPTAAEIVSFYAAISDNVKLPIMVYNFARGTYVEITWEIAAELAQIDHVVCLKDSTTDRLQAIRTLEEVADKLRVFSPFINSLGLAVLRNIGGDGNIDGGALASKYGVAFYEALWSDKIDEARCAARSYNRVLGRIINPDWSARFGSPQAQLKAAMNILGQPGGYVRPPLLPVDDDEALAFLRKVLAEGGLLRDKAA